MVMLWLEIALYPRCKLSVIRVFSLISCIPTLKIENGAKESKKWNRPGKRKKALERLTCKNGVYVHIKDYFGYEFTTIPFAYNVMLKEID